MKKVINTVWIGVCVGMAFLFACCASPNDKKRAQMRDRINEIEEVLSKRSHESIYGSPEMLRERAESTRRLEQERDSLKQELQKAKKERN